MKKLVVFSTLVFTLLAFNVSAATAAHGHKYKAHHKFHKSGHHHGHHADPSYQN